MIIFKRDIWVNNEKRSKLGDLDPVFTVHRMLWSFLEFRFKKRMMVKGMKRTARKEKCSLNRMQVKSENLKRTQACIKKENVGFLHNFTSRGLKTKEPRDGLLH